jgi:hypothetical protein
MQQKEIAYCANLKIMMTYLHLQLWVFLLMARLGPLGREMVNFRPNVQKNNEGMASLFEFSKMELKTVFRLVHLYCFLLVCDRIYLHSQVAPKNPLSLLERILMPTVIIFVYIILISFHTPYICFSRDSCCIAIIFIRTFTACFRTATFDNRQPQF